MGKSPKWMCEYVTQQHNRTMTRLPNTVLSDAEKIKKTTYESTCRKRGQKFVPFIITTDGAVGAEADVLIKKIAAATAAKLKMQKSTVVTWARSRIATALVRASSACIRGSRGTGVRNIRIPGESYRGGSSVASNRRASVQPAERTETLRQPRTASHSNTQKLNPPPPPPLQTLQSRLILSPPGLPGPLPHGHGLPPPPFKEWPRKKI